MLGLSHCVTGEGGAAVEGSAVFTFGIVSLCTVRRGGDSSSFSAQSAAGGAV